MCIRDSYDKGLVTQEDRQYTKSLIETLNGSEIISDELVDKYIHTRALIDEKELEAIFSCNQEFDYQGIEMCIRDRTYTVASERSPCF